MRDIDIFRHFTSLSARSIPGKRAESGRMGERASATLTLCVLLVLDLVLCLQSASATKGGSAAPPPKPLLQSEETPIPVATGTGIVPMTQQDYETYIKSMGHLPVMSKAYIFGRTVPQPKTDKNGHIHVSGTASGPTAGQRR
jgi:hypothetical protein